MGAAAQAEPAERVDNLLAGCEELSPARPTLLRFDADFVTCTQ